MEIKLHQDLFGRRSGDTVTVDGTQGEWAVRQGYATEVDGESTDRTLETSVDADADPTLAVNREDPDDYDAVGDEDEASNSDVVKREDFLANQPVREDPATEKRTRESQIEAGAAGGDDVTDQGADTYDGGETPTVGRVAEPVENPSGTPADDAPVDTADDSKAPEA
jgi:hypothetical protein